VNALLVGGEGGVVRVKTTRRQARVVEGRKVCREAQAGGEAVPGQNREADAQDGIS